MSPPLNVYVTLTFEQSPWHPHQFDSGLGLCSIIVPTFLPERDYITFVYLLSQIRLSFVCLSSVTFVHLTLHSRLKYSAMFRCHFVR